MSSSSCLVIYASEFSECHPPRHPPPTTPSSSPANTVKSRCHIISHIQCTCNLSEPRRHRGRRVIACLLPICSHTSFIAAYRVLGELPSTGSQRLHLHSVPSLPSCIATHSIGWMTWPLRLSPSLHTTRSAVRVVMRLDGQRHASHARILVHTIAGGCLLRQVSSTNELQRQGILVSCVEKQKLLLVAEKLKLHCR